MCPQLKTFGDCATGCTDQALFLSVSIHLRLILSVRVVGLSVHAACLQGKYRGSQASLTVVFLYSVCAVYSLLRSLAAACCAHCCNVQLGMCIALWKHIPELRSVTCHMGSHSVTCHTGQVNAPCLNPSHLPTPEGWKAEYINARLSWPSCWLCAEMAYLSADPST